MKQHEFRKWLADGCPVEGQPTEPKPEPEKLADYIERLRSMPAREWAAEYLAEPRFPDPLTIEFTTTPDKAPKPGEVIKHKGKAFLVDDVRFESGDGPHRCTVRAREAEAALKADTVDASMIALEALKGAKHDMTGHGPPKTGGVFPRSTRGPVEKARLTEREAMRMSKEQLKVWIWTHDVSDHERHELDRLTKAELAEIAMRAKLGECFIGVDPGSREGDSTCFVKMERSPTDGSWTVMKCLTLPRGGHEVTHSHRVDSGDAYACKSSSDFARKMVADIARELEIPHEVARKMLEHKGELVFKVTGGKTTCSF